MKGEPQMNRLVYELSNAEYHSCDGSISKTGLDDINRSPFIYYSRHLDPNRPPRQETPAMVLGTMVHTAVLEPDKFDERYLVAPPCDRRTTMGKQIWAEFQQRLRPGQTIADAEMVTQARAMAASLRDLPSIRDALSEGHAEVSVFWRNEETGVVCRCRPDWVYPAGRGVILLDVKTTVDASQTGFAKAVANYRYDVQAAFYSDGFEEAGVMAVHGFVFAAVEKEWPFAAAAYMLSEDDIEIGREKYRRNLRTYSACLYDNRWPGYSSEIQLLTMPAWAKKVEE